MAELNFNLIKWQRKLFADKTRFQVVVAGRRCGKSRYAVVRAIVKALECPDPTGAVIYVAPTQAMAFKDQIRPAIIHYMKQAVRSDRTTLAAQLGKQGHTDMAEIIRRL